MARPIDETPILEGKDAEEFLKDLNTAKYSKKKEEFLKECEDIYRSTKK